MCKMLLLRCFITIHTHLYWMQAVLRLLHHLLTLSFIPAFGIVTLNSPFFLFCYCYQWQLFRGGFLCWRRVLDFFCCLFSSLLGFSVSFAVRFERLLYIVAMLFRGLFCDAVFFSELFAISILFRMGLFLCNILDVYITFVCYVVSSDTEYYKG